MELKEQCITLEQAKKLKELWFQRDGFYLWRDQENNIHIFNSDEVEQENRMRPTYAAYTVSELMEYIWDTISYTYTLCL